MRCGIRNKEYVIAIDYKKDRILSLTVTLYVRILLVLSPPPQELSPLTGQIAPCYPGLLPRGDTGDTNPGGRSYFIIKILND